MIMVVTMNLIKLTITFPGPSIGAIGSQADTQADGIAASTHAVRRQRQSLGRGDWQTT